MKVSGAHAARGVNPSDLRRINERVVLTAMGPNQQFRVTDLMAATALTRVTVTDVLRQLREKGWVTAEASSGGRGRPAQVYSRLTPPGFAAGMEIGSHDIAVRLADMSGALLRRERVSVRADLPRRERLDRAVALLEQLVEDAGARTSELWSVLAATTGTVTADGVVEQSVAIPDWAGVDLAEELGRRIGAPVHARNDVQLFGRAEHRWGAAAGYQHALLVWLGRRPAVSLILHGRLYEGTHGIAGDLSRVGLAPGETPRFGHGPWQSSDALSDTRPAGADEDRFLSMLTKACEGAPHALTVFEDWVETLAPALSLVAAVIDPEVIVLGGPLVPLADSMLPILERDMNDHLQHPPPINVSTSDGEAVVDAAARYAVENVYSTLMDGADGEICALERRALLPRG